MARKVNNSDQFKIGYYAKADRLFPIPTIEMPALLEHVAGLAISPLIASFL
jgi:hypothetical protein